MGHGEVIARLAGAGADLEIRNRHGFRPLHFAASVGQYGLPRLLLHLRLRLRLRLLLHLRLRLRLRLRLLLHLLCGCGCGCCIAHALNRRSHQPPCYSAAERRPFRSPVPGRPPPPLC